MSVNRYLLPHESTIVTLRHHPAILIPSLTLAAGGLLAAIATGALPHGPRSPQLVVWILETFLIVRAIWAILNWLVEYMVLTDERLLLVYGVLSTRVSMMPISRLKEMTLERTSAGRLFGYGAFTIELGGKVQPVITYIPFPEQIYLEFYSLLVPREPEDDAEEPGDLDEDYPSFDDF